MINPISFGNSEIQKGMANLKTSENLQAQAKESAAAQGGMPGGGGGDYLGMALAGMSGKSQGSGGGDASGKVNQAAQMAYAYLDSQSTGDVAQVDQVMDSKRPPIRVGDLGPGINAQTDGNSITINSSYAQKADVGQIAASILHEANHIAFGGGDKTDEVRAESFAEKFRDSKGIGKFSTQGEINSWANDHYANLPKNGVNYFA